MKLIFNLIDSCILRRPYAGLFNAPVDIDSHEYASQNGYICPKCRMNSIPISAHHTCDNLLQLENKYNMEAK